MARCPACKVDLGVRMRFKLYLVRSWDDMACPKCKAPLRPSWIWVISLWIIACSGSMVALYLTRALYPRPTHRPMLAGLTIYICWFLLFTLLIPILASIRSGSPKLIRLKPEEDSGKAPFQKD